MINELHIRVKPQNSYAKILFFAFFVVAVGCFAASYAFQSYRWILQFVAMLCLVTAILFYTKFVACIYHYDLLPMENASALFVVRQTVGRRTTVLCRIALSQITDICTQTRRQARKEKRSPGRRLYVYTPSLFAKTVHRLTVIDRYESADILIEGEESFLEMLRSYVEEQRAAYPYDIDDE